MAEKAYFKLGGQAEVYLELDNIDSVIEVVRFCQQEGIKLTVIGGASNVVIDDEGIDGLVLHITADNVQPLGQKVDDKQLILAEVGIKTALLVRQVIDLGYQGLEYFLGVPGTLGGAIYNNSHYLTELIGDYVHRVQIIQEDGEVIWLTQAECDFAYDHSRFHQTNEVILRVEFALEKGDPQTSQEKVKEATVKRATTQPLGMPSSGCTFKNTPNTPELRKRFPQFADREFMPSGFLIDQAGLKGTKIGDIEVSDKHAAFFINHGNGTAQDMKKLVKLVKEKVKAEFDVDLEEEIFYLS